MAHSQDSLVDITRAAHEHLDEGELEKAIESFERAAKEAEKAEDASVKLPCFLNAGACFVSAGQYERGLELLEAAVSLIPQAQEDAEIETDGHATSSQKPDLETAADVHYILGVASEGLKDYARARNEFQRSFELYEKSTVNRQQAADALSSLAACCRATGEREQEIVHLSRAQQFYEEAKDYKAEAVACADIARAYLSLDRREECKEHLGKAKLISFRIEDQKTQGRLHAQFGFIYCSLRNFEEALLNLERALPLVRAGQSRTSQQVEASILQNMGAAYNEQGMHSESLAYHTEAAALHSKLGNHVSETKCLCNLASAKFQVRDYSTAASIFSHTLTKAQSPNTNDPHLQFQSSEGLGSCHFHMRQYSEAISSFNTALEALDRLEEGDTGIPRERIKEKLSDAAEALAELQEEAVLTSSAGSGHRTRASDSPHSVSPDRTSQQSLPPPEPDTTQSTHSTVTTTSPVLLPAPPLPPRQSPVTKTRKGKEPQRLRAKKGKRTDRSENERRKRTTPHRAQPAAITPQDSYDEKIRDYEKTLESSSSSSEEEIDTVLRPDEVTHSHLGLTLTATEPSNQQAPSPTSVPVSSQMQSRPHPQHVRLQVQENSLAIGPNARDNYTTHDTVITHKGRRIVHSTEIIPTDRGSASASGTQQASITPSHTHTDRNTGTESTGSTFCSVL